MNSSLGTRLREIRERRGVSLTRIAEDTKINAALLDGLERDDVSRWPGGIFRRAYVRAYARAVGLEPEGVVREFLDMHPDPMGAAPAESAAQRKTGAAAGSYPGIAGAGPAQCQEDETLERDLSGVASLCMALGRAEDQEAVTGILRDAGRILGARGVILWVWDAVRASLCPAIAHGYSDATIQQLALVARSTDTATTAAFRTGEARAVEGGGGRATGAFVTPLLTPRGCAGVLAMEFADGAEQRKSIQAFATILGAQLATLLPASENGIAAAGHRTAQASFTVSPNGRV